MPRPSFPCFFFESCIDVLALVMRFFMQLLSVCINVEQRKNEKRKVGGHPMLHKEDKRGFALREREFGRQVFFSGRTK